MQFIGLLNDGWFHCRGETKEKNRLELLWKITGKLEWTRGEVLRSWINNNALLNYPLPVGWGRTQNIQNKPSTAEHREIQSSRLWKLMGEACPCSLPCAIGSSAGFRCSSCLGVFLVQRTMCIQSVFSCYLSPSETALMHLLVPPLFVSSHWWVFWVCLGLVGGNMAKKKAWGRTLAWKCEFSSWSRHISGGLPTKQLSMVQ